MLDCWMDGRLRLSHPQNKTEGRDELLEVVSRGTMGWTDRDRTDYVEHVSLRPVWLETVLGRVGSQSVRSIWCTAPTAAGSLLLCWLYICRTHYGPPEGNAFPHFFAPE